MQRTEEVSSMTKFTTKLAGGMAATVALATAFTGAQATTTGLFGGGSTAAEKVYRDVFNQYGNQAGGDLCVGLTAIAGGCPATVYRSNVEPFYVGVGSGNGKAALDSYDPSKYVQNNKKPDAVPVPSTRDFGPFYGTGTGSGWTPTVGGSGNYYPKVSFSGSDDPLTATDVFVYGNRFGHLVQFPTVVIPVAVPFHPTATWTPKNALPVGGSSKVNLSTNTLCGIWTGAITDWSDAEIKADNKNVQLGSGTIHPVYRNDGSGTTFLFSNGLLNQCGTTSHPVSTHPIPDSWLTATVQGTAITYNPTPTPLASYYTSNNNFFINVFKNGLLPSNFYNDAGGFSGVTGGCNGSGGVQKCVDLTVGAIGYISPDFVQPILTGNDSNGQPISAAANLQTYHSFITNTAKTFEPPSAAKAATIMFSAVPPDFTGATPSAANPLNWGVVNPTPAGVTSYPIGGFTFVDMYSCYASATDVSALVGTTAGSLGLWRWYFGTSTENGGTPAARLAANGFAPIPALWATRIRTLLTSSAITKVSTPGKAKTACATVSSGA